MKTINTLLTASFIFSLVVANTSFADDRKAAKNHNDNHSREYRQDRNNRNYDNNRNNRHDRHVVINTTHNHYHDKKHRDYRRNYYPFGYFVGGAIVGSLLTHDYREREVIRPITRISYWRDNYGDCFRIEERGGRESYIAVAARFCY